MEFRILLIFINFQLQKVKLKKFGNRYGAKIRFGSHEWYDNSICKVSAPLELHILSYCKRSVTGLKIKKRGIRIEWAVKKNYVTENCQHSLLAFCKAARAHHAHAAHCAAHFGGKLKFRQKNQKIFFLDFRKNQLFCWNDIF